MNLVASPWVHSRGIWLSSRRRRRASHHLDQRRRGARDQSPPDPTTTCGSRQRGGHMRLIVLAIVLCAPHRRQFHSRSFSRKAPPELSYPIRRGRQLSQTRATRLSNAIFPFGLVLVPQRDGTLVDVTAKVSPGSIRAGPSGDFNGDGRLDIFSPGGPDEFGDPAVMSSLWLGQPDGTYKDASALLPGVADQVGCAAVGDVNGDGYLDIYVGNVGSDTSRIGPYFLLNNEGTSFTRTSSNLPPDIASLQVLYFTCVLLDVDGDGHPDLVLGGRGAKAPSVILLNDGHGDFTRRPPMPLPPGAFDGSDLNTINISYTVIDLNGDGFPDLLVSQTQARPLYAGHAIQLLINDGHGEFTDQTSAYIRDAVDPAHNWIAGLVVADLNGDGIPDFYAQGIFHRDHTHPPTDWPTFAWVSDGLGHWNPMTTKDLDPTELRFSLHIHDRHRR